ncbi:conserved exported protein of unknown function [Hyphomicrobium sp. 1Nfss2.1]
MSSMMRLTVLSAAVLLVTAAHALAQTGTAQTGTAAPGTGSAQPAESQAAPPPSQNGSDRPAPSGCPYRDGKLELIV